MELAVLVDNNTLIDRYFIGEPAVSYFIEDGGNRILYDVGYSDAFITNAQKLGIDLLDLDYIVISHGHLDHMWGLDPLLRLYTEASLEGRALRKPTVVIHPRTFADRPRAWLGGSHALVSEERLLHYFAIQRIEEPLWLTNSLVCLPDIPKTNDFEVQSPMGRVLIDGHEVDDYIEDEIAIACKTENGLVVSNPCSHRGVCNTLEYAKRVCDDNRIADVIGGFHLQKPDARVLDGTVAYFANNPPTTVHTCHCTDLHSKIALSAVANLEEVGSGLRLSW